ncbi:MAG: PAS domain S-box protein [Elusimicrobia bacterium]|nr:PAS domain S-box protein [Elusimicrobiota bacterium]
MIGNPLALTDPTGYRLSLYAIPPVVTMAAIFLLGLVVLVGERRSLVSVLFFLMTITISVWLLGISGVYCAIIEPLAVWWAKIEHVGVHLIPAAVYHFTVASLRIVAQHRRTVRIGWLISVGCVALTFQNDALVGHVSRFWWGYYPRYGWANAPFLIFFFVMMVASLRQYWVEYRNALPGSVDQHRAKSFLLAFGVGYLGSVDYLATYAIPCYPFGYLPVLGFLVMAARTIWRYHLVDLTPAFAASQILTTMDDLLIVCDDRGTIRVVNPVVSSLLGYTEAELLGQPMARLAPFFSEQHDNWLKAVEHGPQRDQEVPFCAKQGGFVDMSVSLSPLPHQGHAPVGAVLIARDIRARKQAEQTQQALAAAAAAAGAAAQKRAEELAHACEELKRTQALLIQAEKMAAIGQLASGTAHEVRNPLSIIKLGAEQLERIVPSQPGHQEAEILALMKEAVTRADKIIRGMLDFSRPANLELKPAALPLVIDDALLLVGTQLATHDIRVIKEFAQDVPVVLLDENQMRQVFINLILNAFQAMPHGGQLTIRCLRTTLETVASQVGRRRSDAFQPGESVVVCEISDTGPGISEDHLTRIFDPFFTTKPPGQGTGLGLTITRVIVEQHGGLITIDSQAGRGTTVRVMLPCRALTSESAGAGAAGVNGIPTPPCASMEGGGLP